MATVAVAVMEAAVTTEAGVTMNVTVAMEAAMSIARSATAGAGR